jgi:hypothetical protein
MLAYNQELAKAGIFKEGDGLKPSSVGTRVRRAGKQVTVIDGPFAETKELVAGYSVIEVASKQEAIEIVRRWPVEDGDVELELRLLYGPEDFPADLAAGEPPPPPARNPATTRYALLIKSSARTEAGAAPDPVVMKRMDDLIGEAAARGAMLGGQGLKPSALGAKLTRVGKKVTVIDGPFTESKEMIAGFTLLQVATKQEAIDFAKRWLEIHVDWSGGDGEVEVRPLYEAADFGL